MKLCNLDSINRLHDSFYTHLDTAVWVRKYKLKIYVCIQLFIDKTLKAQGQEIFLFSIECNRILKVVDHHH